MRGGARKGAGRKRTRARSTPHRPRTKFDGLTVVHVGFHVLSHVWNLRKQRPFKVLKRAIERSAKRFETRIIHFSVLSNHVHLIVESKSTEWLSSAMKGLCGSSAKRLNKLMGRKGQVIEDRHFTKIIRTRRAAAKVMRYVRENYRKHTGAPDAWKVGVTIDPRSSWAHLVLLPSALSTLLRYTDPFS